MTIDDIIRRNRAIGHHFFDTDTKRFFGSRILPTVYGGRFFITAEKSMRGGRSKYTVRESLPDGSVASRSEFREFKTPREAIAAAKKLITRSNPRRKGGRRYRRNSGAGCPMCGGPGIELGALGMLRHFRCRDCGAQYNKKSRRRLWRKKAVKKNPRRYSRRRR